MDHGSLVYLPVKDMEIKAKINYSFEWSIAKFIGVLSCRVNKIMIYHERRG